MPDYVYIVSLGCPKNFVDTEIIAASLLGEGFGLTSDLSCASYYLINTCAFIESARKETEEHIREAVEWKKTEGGKLVVCGCIRQWSGFREFRKMFPEVDFWFGPDEASELGKKVRKPANSIKPTGESPVTPPSLYDHTIPRLQLTPAHYAYLKIAEGCSNRCSYCSIPEIRGPFRSRTADSVLKEAAVLLENGVRELILIAQDTTAFGTDRRKDGEDIAYLTERLNGLEGDFIFRILYTHPAHYSAEFIDTLARAKRFIAYLDIPLQHISDPVLESMGRMTTEREIRALLRRLRDAIPGLGIRTSFITGYPGESEDDFKNLRDFVQEQRFERLGVFAYSPESGTEAGNKMALPGAVRKDRAREIMQIQSKISLQRNIELVGKVIDVIIDSVDSGFGTGRGMHDAPDIDNDVRVENCPEDTIPGDILRVRVRGAGEYTLNGAAEHKQALESHSGK